MKNKKRTLVTITAMILLLSVVTYAYYTTGLSNSNAQTAELSTGTMSLTFDDGDNGIAAVLNFGSTITKKFTLQNTGSLDASASISWFNLVNTYLAGSLMYTLEYSETLEGEYEPVVSNLMVPTSEEPITTPLVTQVTVPVGKTYYYNLNITLVNSEVIDQTSDINASFHTQFTIKDASSLSASEQTLANLGLVVSNGTPDFSKAAGTLKGVYGDNGFTTSVDTYNMKLYSSIDGESIFYYSDTYTIDENTGEYSLGTLKSGTYKNIYNTLKNKYIYADSYGPSPWWNTTTSSNIILKITSATYDSNTNSGSFMYYTSINTLPDYSKTGIYTMEDDYGTSYYFRGSPENNYVKFGKWSDESPTLYCDNGVCYDTLEECTWRNCIKFNRAGKDMYWRIVRINGDGSLRLVYDGIEPHVNGGNLENVYIDKGSSTGYNNIIITNGAVGYMHGLETLTGQCYVDGEIVEDVEPNTGQSFCEDEFEGEWIPMEVDKDRCLMLDENRNVVDNINTYSNKTTCENAGGIWTTTGYEATHANIRNSNAKTTLDKWYKDNIENTIYENAISDTLFCNDRSLSDGLGVGYEYTEYKAFERLNNNHIPTPQLKCPQQHDSFTVDDTIKGNGALTYSIGLLTGDEIMLAGAYHYDRESNNNMFYLRKNVALGVISMTPSNYEFYYPNNYVIDSSLGSYETNEVYNILPVINLTPEYVSQMIGDGTIGNEFRVE